MEFNEEDFLQLSGIQHFIFCKRQWALIHIEKQWCENEKTVDGQFFHKNAHDKIRHERRGNTLISRGMYVHSRELGLSGQCDVVEFYKCENGINIVGEKDLWQPYPIEYKRGKKKPTLCDEAQVCAQAMCLEEMYCCNIPEGAIYYGENRHRMNVDLNEKIRNLVRESVKEMHDLYTRGQNPKVHKKKSCESCSLVGICMPELFEENTVDDYIQRMIKLEK